MSSASTQTVLVSFYKAARDKLGILWLSEVRDALKHSIAGRKLRALGPWVLGYLRYVSPSHTQAKVTRVTEVTLLGTSHRHGAVHSCCCRRCRASSSVWRRSIQTQTQRRDAARQLVHVLCSLYACLLAAPGSVAFRPDDGTVPSYCPDAEIC